jgi:hypothetical protein
MADQQPVAGGSGGNNANVAQNIMVNPAAQHAAAQLAQQILANINVTLRQEIVKIPEYYGEKTKDTVSAQEFINRINECQVSNDWNDTTTYANFRLCLRGKAEEWLSSTFYISSSLRRRKLGQGCAHFLKRNSPPLPTINLSSMDSLTWHINMEKTP